MGIMKGKSENISTKKKKIPIKNARRRMLKGTKPKAIAIHQLIKLAIGF